MDEFFSHTKKSFRNLIREDEQKQMESSIWKQIDGGNENDYIYFHMRKVTVLIFLFLTMEELWRHLNMAGCFM